MNSIPSVNLKDFLSEDPSRKKKFVESIRRAYEEIGFVALKGHFLSDMKLDVLDICIDEKNPKQFKDITAGDFLNQRLVELGLIKK